MNGQTLVFVRLGLGYRDLKLGLGHIILQLTGDRLDKTLIQNLTFKIDGIIDKHALWFILTLYTMITDAGIELSCHVII